VKVCIVTAFPQDPARPHGGVEAVSVTLVAALAGRPGLDLQVVTADRRLTAPRVDYWQGVPVHRVPWRGRWTLTSALGVARRDVCAAVTALAPDVVHAHDTFGIMTRGLPYPSVLTIHGFIHGDTKVAAGRLAGPRAALWRRAEHRTWAEADHIIAISPYVRERLAGIARGVIHDIDNPIGVDFFDLPRRDEAPAVFSAAVISRRKNTLALVAAAALLRRTGVLFQMRLAGAIVEPGYGRRVNEQIAALGLGGHVVCLGPLPSGLVQQELSRARAFALVSREENSPLGIEEAMAAGVPVVTSNRCGMPYMVRDGETGFLVDPEDPLDIARRLATVLTDSARHIAMSERSRSVARDRFHPDRVADRTVAVYERAAGG
jgi:glycosyltransferase involved in cell wall biosynthesis